MSNTQENYVDKANATAIINKIETKLNNRYTKDEVDTLVESASGGGNANVEKATYDTTPATKPHAVDSFVYFNNVVYKVTSAIAIGDTIAVGTNISADTGLVEGTQMYIDNLPGDGGGGQTVPDGKTVLPVNNVGIWAQCAGQQTQYTQLSQVLEDSILLGSLISNQNACDYLVRSTSWVSDICSDEDAMEMIGLNNYCSDTLLADSTWLNAILDSDYVNSVMNIHVPTMTSNTTPSGSVLYSRIYGDESTGAYRVFDGDLNSGIGLDAFNNVSDNYIGYDFTTPKVVRYVRVYQLIDGDRYYFYSWKFEGSNDNSTWVQLDDVTANTESVATRVLTNTTAYRYYRCHLIRNTRSELPYYAIANELQFYGRQDV